MLGHLRNYFSNKSGSSALVFALSAAVIVGAGGAGIDYGHAVLLQSNLQQTLDAAVLAGVAVSVTPARKKSAAEAYFKRNADSTSSKFNVSFSIQGDNLVGSADGSAETTLLRVLNINQVKLAAKSTATATAYDEPLCLMAMNPTRKHTLEMNGNVSIYAPDCNIYGNSDNKDDVIDPHTPNNYMAGKFIATIGGGHHYLENVTPPPEFGTKQIADPLAATAIPAGGACTQTNMVISGSTIELPEGHYCGGLKISNGAVVTLAPGGTYYISGGTFSVISSTVSGIGVTIFLTDASTKINWKDSQVALSAKKTGAYAGFVLLGARFDTSNTFDSSTVDVHGAFYMPNGAFDWVNDGTPVLTAKWSAFIVDGFSWSGNGTVNLNFDLAHSDIPYPQALMVMPRPGQPRLVN